MIGFVDEWAVACWLLGDERRPTVISQWYSYESDARQHLKVESLAHPTLDHVLVGRSWEVV